MYKTQRLLALAMSVTLLVTLSPTAASARADVQQVRFSGSFPFTLSFDCVGEPLSGIVAFKGQMQVTNNASGGQTSNIHTVYFGRGQGDVTGIEFFGPQAEQETLHVNGNNGQFTDTYTINFVAIRSGSADNLSVRLRFHITINANGEVVSEIDSFEVQCRG